MSTIFISHSSQDNDIAREIERRLAMQGHHSVFLDIDPEKGIVGGQSWERTLYRKLRACRAVIALCTDRYLDSHWCFAEIALARMEGKHIIALQADPLDEQVKMPAILTERQFIDLRRDGEEGYQRLLDALEKLEIITGIKSPDPKESPYLGLSAYQEKHASLFFGREDESRAGIELLDRGAPDLIMVLGASGSGKSSLVRAGMLPRLRSRKDEWLIVDPFRPGRDPMAELTESLVQSFRRYAPEHAVESGSRERIRERLHAGLPDPSISAPLAADESEGPEKTPDAAEDERLRRLMDLLERLHEDPPTLLAGRLRDYLEWSLDDLRRICGEQAAVVSSPEIISHYTTPLIEITHDLRQVSQRREARVLLVIDQFEELLGRKKADEETSRFLALLRASIEADHSPLMILGTMRSDFLGLFQRNAALRGIDFESLSLGPMKIEGMRRVIEEPARLTALELESGLADRLLEDTETPDALPLLSFTLEVLWRKHHGNHKFEIADYENLGGLQGAITGEADAVRESARRKHREDDLRKALIQMARLSEDGRYARRPVGWDSPEIRRIEPILKKLIERRILVSRVEGERRIVEVAHEALFRAWKPLRAWLDNARSELLLKQQLERDAATWQENNRATAILWRGGRLLQARELMVKQNLRNAARKGSLVAEFVRAGLRRRLMVRAMVGATTLAVIAALAGIAFVATNERNAAQQQRDIALSRQLAIQAANDLPPSSKSSGRQNYAQALLKAVHAVHAQPTFEARSSLLSSLLVPEYLLQYLWGHHDMVVSVAFSPDGKKLATASYDNTVILWDVDRRKPIGKPLRGHTQAVRSIAFSPDGKILASASDDNTVILWDVDQRNPIDKLLQSHQNRVISVTFSPDGKMLATAGGDKIVILWDVDRRSPIGDPLKGHQDRIYSVAFSPNGKILAGETGDRTVILWDVDRREAIGKPLDGFGSIAFSPDGKVLATASYHNTVILWDIGHLNNPIGDPLKSHPGRLRHVLIKSMAFSPDGRILAVASTDGTVVLWDVDRSKPKPIGKPLKGHQHTVFSVAFSPDGKILATASGDNTVILWDVHHDKLLRVHKQAVRSIIAFSPDGKILATSSKDNTLILWDIDQRQPIGKPLKGHQSTVFKGAFSPDGKILATTSGDNTVILWDVELQIPIGKPLKFESGAISLQSITFRSDGKILVAGYNYNIIYLWDVDQDKPVEDVLTGHKRRVNSLTFSPDSKILASASEDEVILWDVERRESIGEPLKGHRGVSSVAFSPDGKILSTAGGVYNNTAGGDGNYKLILWDVDQRKPIGEPLEGHRGVRSVAFSPDGKILATAGGDYNLILWDVNRRKPIGDPLKGHQGRVYRVAFSPDGKKLASTSEENTMILWDVGLDSWVRLACRMANRNLSRKEWAEIVGTEVDYEPVCQGFPVPED